MFRFDAEKALETILYVASKAKADKYATLKILYLADKLHLERYGRFISGDYYNALEDGATPMLSYDLIEYADGNKHQFFEAGVREALQVGTDASKHDLVPRRAPNLDALSESDVECLNEILARLENVAPSNYWKALIDEVHDDAWRKTWCEKQNSRMAVERIAEQFPDADELIDYLRQA
jgi:hypothetical protein